MEGSPILSVPLLLVLLSMAAVVGVLPQETVLRKTRGGWIAVLIAAVLLPGAALWKGAERSLKQSSHTSFCLSCHEMEPYGQSLHLDDREVIAAVHFQNNLVDRNVACYTCHRDYALFGDITTKLNGLRHVYRHYVAGPPEKIALYQPYKNRNCLSCHGTARSFLESTHHQGDNVSRADMVEGKLSCLSAGCHTVAHAIADLEDGDFWPNAGENDDT